MAFGLKGTGQVEMSIDLTDVMDVDFGCFRQLRYITSKITLLLQPYSLVIFEVVLLPRKKNFEVYFSTGNKGVDDEENLPDFALTIKGSCQISFSCSEFR
ncbi:MAG: hypothetical protein WBN94_05835 [Methanothrix sp.]